MSAQSVSNQKKDESTWATRIANYNVKTPQPKNEETLKLTEGFAEAHRRIFSNVGQKNSILEEAVVKLNIASAWLEKRTQTRNFESTIRKY